jgi:hypothetical protein
MALNVCGIKSKLEIDEFIDLCQSYDIICLTETKTDDTDNEELYEIFNDIGFEMSISNRCHFTNWRSGGVILAVKTEIISECKFCKIKSDICVCVTISKEFLGYDKDLVVIAVYIPPYRSRYSSVDLFDDLMQIILEFDIDTHYFLICGDMNAHTQEKDDLLQLDMYITQEMDLDAETLENLFVTKQMELLDIPLQRKSIDKHPDNGGYGNALLNMCKNMMLCIMNGRCGMDRYVGKATTTEKSVIDYMVASPFILSKVKKFFVHDFDCLLSDKHCIVEVQLHSEQKSVYVRDDVEDPGNLRCNSLLSDAKEIGKWDNEKMKEYIDGIDITKVQNVLHNIDNMSVDEITNIIGSIMIESAKSTFPVREVSRITNRSRPQKRAIWFDKKCRTKRQEYLKAKKKHNNQKNETNEMDMKTKSKEYKKEMSRAKIHYRKKFNKDLRKTRSKDPKLYWKMLQCKTKSKMSSQVLIQDFYNHFKDLSDQQIDNSVDNFDPVQNNIFDTDTLNVEFTEDEIRKCIQKLKNGKAAGVDKIINEYIKSTVEIMIPVYVALFNKILNSGSIPESWVIGLIVPIYKNKGDADDCNNYRGITLLSCLGKLFTSVLNNRLYNFCEDNAIINELQTGFRKGYSTVDHIFLLKHVIDLYCYKKKKLFCAFVDYSKAFDTVWRDALWYKLRQSGIDGKLLDVIVSIYRHIKSCVFVNGTTSDYFASLTGVRQGENLSPLLFALFINDLEEFLLENACEPINFNDAEIDNYLRLMVLMYADDAILMSTTKEGLQRAIEVMCRYSDEWKLKINSSKTKVTIFGNRKIDASKFTFVVNNDELEIVHCFKYLGILFNYNGSFRNALDDLKNQASRAMFALLNKCRKLNLPIDIRLELFDALVMPILLYACEVWGFEKIDILERLHLKFLKYTLRVKMSTCNNMIYGELGRFPLIIHIRTRMIAYWARLLHGKHTKLSKTMYTCLHNLYISGQYVSPWVADIKKILDDCGYSNIWQQQNFVSVEWLKMSVEQRLKDQFIQKWYQELESMSSCDLYVEFKKEFKMEKYLLLENVKYRQAICNLRLNNNRIPKVVGRYKNIVRNRRFCNLCDGNSVGDEFHILFECNNTTIVDARKLLPRYYTFIPSMFKLVCLLQSQKPKVLWKIGAFLKNVLPLFK